MARKRIRPADKVPLSLSAQERKVILGKVFMDQNLEKQIQIAHVHGKKFVSKFTLSDLEELHGYISFEYNHTKGNKLKKILGRVLSRINLLFDAYTDDEPENDNLFALPELSESKITIHGDKYFKNPKNDFERFISESMDGKVFDSLDELNKFLSIKNTEYNQTPRDDMSGLSPEQVSSLINFKWDDEKCSLRLNENLSYEDVQKTPIIMNARYFLAALEEEGSVKATASKGNLNRKFVLRIIEGMVWPKNYVERFFEIAKVVNEEDMFPLHVLRLLLQESKFIRKAKGFFKITKMGKSFLSENRTGELFLLLFKTLFTRINLAYLDRMPKWNSFQWTIPFVFHRFGALGSKWAKPEDLAPLLLLPKVKEEILGSFARQEIHWVLQKRFIEPFESFGLIEKQYLPKKDWREPYEIRKTSLYDKFLGFEFRKSKISFDSGMYH